MFEEAKTNVWVEDMYCTSSPSSQFSPDPASVNAGVMATDTDMHHAHPCGSSWAGGGRMSRGSEASAINRNTLVAVITLALPPWRD